MNQILGKISYGGIMPFPQHGSALQTDLYELTMACAYWKSGTADKEAVFHLFFRTPPFQSGFTIACGLAPAIDYLRDLRFEDSAHARLPAYSPVSAVQRPDLGIEFLEPRDGLEALDHQRFDRRVVGGGRQPERERTCHLSDGWSGSVPSTSRARSRR